jgi:DNA excision repair protein ERCC-3
MEDDLRMRYSVADDREKFRLASENPEKLRAIDYILRKHSKNNILIIGQYINQLEEISAKFKIPLITGKTPLPERQELYQAFRTGQIKQLVVSKVANFSIDLPDANIAIQVSGTFGSRQEEAQRLGRILRPKSVDNTAIFFSLISRDTNEERFGQNRQLFLTEQGYEYEIYTLDQFKETVSEELLTK